MVYTKKVCRSVLLRVCYSQTCSNDHLYKTTTCLRQPILRPPKQIPIQSLLYKTTTSLMQPATIFFVWQMKKNLSKTTTTKLYPARKWKTNIRQQCINIRHLSDYITLMLLYNASLLNVYMSWTIYKII